MIYAATRAPSPGNSQGWDFVVVRDPDLKAQIAEVIAGPFGQMRAVMPALDDPEVKLMTEGAAHLVSSLGRVPVLIFVCGAPCYPPHAPMEQFVWPALYPATQNLLLAARALGLGTALTTFHMLAPGQIQSLLGIPRDVRVAAMIPMGWPDRPFGPVRRKPIDEVLHWDRW